MITYRVGDSYPGNGYAEVEILNGGPGRFKVASVLRCPDSKILIYIDKDLEQMVLEDLQVLNELVSEAQMVTTLWEADKNLTPQEIIAALEKEKA